MFVQFLHPAAGRTGVFMYALMHLSACLSLTQWSVWAANDRWSSPPPVTYLSARPRRSSSVFLSRIFSFVSGDTENEVTEGQRWLRWEGLHQSISQSASPSHPSCLTFSLRLLQFLSSVSRYLRPVFKKSALRHRGGNKAVKWCMFYSEKEQLSANRTDDFPVRKVRKSSLKKPHLQSRIATEKWVHPLIQRLDKRNIIWECRENGLQWIWFYITTEKNVFSSVQINPEISFCGLREAWFFFCLNLASNIYKYLKIARCAF